MNTQNERILIFGDSLSHPGPDGGPTIIDVKFGDREPDSAAVSSAPGAVLAASLLEDAHAQAVRIDARVGRSAKSFFTIENASALLASNRAFRPTKVIIMLGTNDIDRGVSQSALGSTKSAMTQIRDAYRAMGAEVFAIGPPSYLSDHYNQGAAAMLMAMREVFGTDRTFDARLLTLGTERTSDGIHFTQRGAAVAGTQLARFVTFQPPAVAAPTTSTGAKVAAGLFGAVTVVTLGWLAWRFAKQVAHRQRLGWT